MPVPPSPRGRDHTQNQLPTGSVAPFLWQEHLQLPTAHTPNPRFPGAGQLAFSAAAINIKHLNPDHSAKQSFASHWYTLRSWHDSPCSDGKTVNHISRLFCWPLCCRFPPIGPVPYLKLCYLVPEVTWAQRTFRWWQWRNLPCTAVVHNSS